MDWYGFASLFGHLIDLICFLLQGMTSFAFNKFQQALDFFSRAVTTHPECDASVRTAIAACSFKLQQYDRARIALHRANMMDVRFILRIDIITRLILSPAHFIGC